MIKSYVAKTTINFVDHEFYVRPGDLLVHDTSNHSRLTVHRNGQIVKVVKQSSLAIGAFKKNKFIEEVPPDAPVVVEVSKPTQVTDEPPVTAPEPVKPAYSKRDKAVPKEVLISDTPRLLAALGITREEQLAKEAAQQELITTEK